MNETMETTETLEPVKTAAQRSGGSKPVVPRNAPPAASEPHPSRLHLTDDHDEDEGFFERHRAKLIAIAVLVIGGTITYIAMNTEKSQIKKAPERKVVSIQLPPPPAPPPPPPPPKLQPPPPKEEKMVEQKPVEDTPKPPEKPADEPPAIGTGIKGDGKADGFGVGKSGNGGRIGGNGNGGGGGRFDMYAGQVQTTVANGLRRNPKTRGATIDRVLVRIWLDSTGRITRAKLGSSSGDASVDAAMNSELLGAQLPPPPQGMPMPVVMRISAQRR